MNFEITKIQKYGKGRYSSEKIGIQWYNIVYLRVFTDDTKQRFYKVHFLHMFDAEDLYFFVNPDDETNDDPTETDVKNCRNELCYFAAESICSYNNIKDIINACNETIERYK